MTLVKKKESSGTKYSKSNKKSSYLNLRVDFSLRKEIFFVTIGSLIGGFTMFIPRMIFDFTIGTQYYLVWLAFSKTVNSNSVEVGALIHFAVATIIGIITGIILYKGNFLNISKISNGILYGGIAGTVVFLIFFIPVQQFVLAPNMAQVLAELDPEMTITDATKFLEENYSNTLLDSVVTHLIWGITVGVVSSFLTREFGANYRCNVCDVQFSKMQTFERHHKHRHESISPKIKRVLILGGGFGGVQVLREVQDALEDEVDVDISLVSEDNFFLFTPLLPEMSTGMIEPRHISTPVRTFCKRARFYEAVVESIDLKKKRVTICRTYDKKMKDLEYDHLVLAIGSRTNFFGNKKIEKNALTIKTLGDAIGIRNHVITMLENADQEDDSDLRSKFLTFVIVGGGFSGVETVGELNDYVRESTLNFYRKLDVNKIRVVLVSAGDGILPELGKSLGDFALESLKKTGVEVLTNTKVVDAEEDYVKLSNGQTISFGTLIWAGGIAMDPVLQNLDCQHDDRGKIIVDDHLQIVNHKNVYALGDCASIIDKNTGKPYPPTAQHSVREAKVVSKNLVSSIKRSNHLQTFQYKTKGTMAKIGKRNGVALLMGHKVRGFLAWLIWRQYYLANLPTREKKIRVALDWMIALFFKPDITRLRNLKDKSFNF